VGRKSITGGVAPLRAHRIQFDFTIAGVRYRPTLPWIPHAANLRRAQELLTRIKVRIAAGTFIFTEEFPDYRGRKTLHLPFCARTCGDVFDAFLLHEAARVRRGDLAPITLAAHRQILDHVWRPDIGTMALLAVRYSTLVKVADGHRWTKKTYNNVISALGSDSQDALRGPWIPFAQHAAQSSREVEPRGDGFRPGGDCNPGPVGASM
jgi:hypothetical protein